MLQPPIIPIPRIVCPVQQHRPLRVVHRPIRQRLPMLLHILRSRKTPARLVFLKLLNHGRQFQRPFARRYHIAERKLLTNRFLQQHFPVIRIAAAGRWAVSFPKRDDLLFTSAVTGNCLILRPRSAAVHLNQGDFALIRTITPFSFASDRSAKPIRSEDIFTEATTETIRLGRGKTNRVLLQGGKFLFHSANEQLLLHMLPALIHIRATDSSASRIQTLLNLNAQESLQTALGSEFVVARVMEVVLVELLRSRINENAAIQPGLLSGLATPAVAAALRALHQNVAHHLPSFPWTLHGQSLVDPSRRPSRAQTNLVSPHYLVAPM